MNRKKMVATVNKVRRAWLASEREARRASTAALRETCKAVESGDFGRAATLFGDVAQWSPRAKSADFNSLKSTFSKIATAPAVKGKPKAVPAETPAA